MTSSVIASDVRLDGRTALVTGGSRGIGRAISRRLAADGAHVVVHYGHDEAAAADTVAAIEDDGGTAVAIPADLARPDAAYVMSKGAVDVMGRSLAPTLGERGITINAVAPGLTDTDLMTEVIEQGDVRARAGAATAMGRVGEPEDIADVVAFLASHRARWITGQVLDASGGLFVRPAL